MENTLRPTGIILFDLENALLQNKFLDVCAKEFNFSQALALLRHIDIDQTSLARRTASFLTGKKREQLLNVVASIPLVENIREVITELKGRGYAVGVVSEAYLFITEFIANKINADFCLANDLAMHESFITGELVINNYFLHSDLSSCQHRACKSNALLYAAKKYGVRLDNCIFVGDVEQDDCIIKHTGMYIDMRSSNELFTRDAKKRLVRETFDTLLNYTLR